MTAPINKKMTIVTLEQGSDEWHEYRKTKGGASEVSYLFGVNPFCGAQDQEKYLIGLKLGFNTIFQNTAMRAGNENEADIVKAVEEKYDIITQPLVGYIDNISASFDGITLDNDVVVEVKYSDSTYEAVKNGEVPKHYLLQVHQQLYVSGARRAIFAAMHTQTRDVAMVEVYPDADIIDDIVQKWSDFFDRLNSKEWAEDDFNEERDDDEWLEAVSYYRVCKEEEERAKERVNEAKEKLINLAGGVRAKGFGVSVYPVKPRKTVNWQKLAKDNGLKPTEKYEKIGQPSWSVRVTK